jgi:hypothetical protein
MTWFLVAAIAYLLFVYFLSVLAFQPKAGTFKVVVEYSDGTRSSFVCKGRNREEAENDLKFNLTLGTYTYSPRPDGFLEIKKIKAIILEGGKK